MPGRVLEIALASVDIQASFEWWSRLGFASATTGDAWSHPYGVLSVPGLNLALHGTSIDGPALTLVRPELASFLPLLEERGVTPAAVSLGPEVFNELWFSDPAGLPVRLLEARTFSPVHDASDALAGRFEALSWPAADPLAVAAFWRRLHVECASGEDWSELRADIGGQAVGWHSPRLSPEPLLVFRHPEPGRARARLVDEGFDPSPRGLPLQQSHVLVTSPEGQKLLVLA